MKQVAKRIAAQYCKGCASAYTFVEKHGNIFMLVFGSVLVLGGVAELSIAQSDTVTSSFSNAAYDDGLVKASVTNLFCLIEGAFGALIMVVAGLGAIVAAAMGAYRAAVGMLVVAVGAFILRSLVSLFFGADFGDVYTPQDGVASTTCQ